MDNDKKMYHLPDGFRVKIIASTVDTTIAIQTAEIIPIVISKHLIDLYQGTDLLLNKIKALYKDENMHIYQKFKFIVYEISPLESFFYLFQKLA